MILSELVGIIADDLTGANDTALQFHNSGANTKILLNNEISLDTKTDADVWALSTESRNLTIDNAIDALQKTVNLVKEHFSFNYIYKKIDSTLRGHIAIETLLVLEMLEYDAAIIIPAFPQEGRTTVGGYHLLKGIPIGRTEVAIDPHSPITESHIPTLLKTQLDEELQNFIGVLDLKTVMNGAGPILIKLNDLIKEGKKLIIADAVCITDIEQIALAINKSSKKILPTGTAAGAQVMAKYWLSGIDNEREIVKIPKLPKFIVSGTATKITAEQLEKLEQSDDYNDINFIPLDIRNILDGVTSDIVQRIVSNLESGVSVAVHTSHLITNFDGFSDDSFNAELTKEKLGFMITDYLAELTKEVLTQVNAILITLGGETSYKCCRAIGLSELQIVDEVAPAISLCISSNKKWIVTKSGNLGNTKTLIDILNYLKCHEQICE